MSLSGVGEVAARTRAEIKGSSRLAAFSMHVGRTKSEVIIDNAVIIEASQLVGALS